MKSPADSFALSNGLKIPCIGYGTWKIADGPATVRAVTDAIRSGYTHIDTAAAYGNEVSVGAALQPFSSIRSDLFISGKLWNSKWGYAKALKAYRSSLERLQQDYLDMYLIHWPASPVACENWKEINAETWRAFEELYEAGKVKAIGVCNFLPHHLEALMETARIAPMVNQIEYHPGMPQNETVEFCNRHRILVEAWSPLGNGRMLEHEGLKAAASKYGKSVAQLCIKWCLLNGVLPVTKTESPQRMKENADVFDFVISEQDKAMMDSIPEFGGSGFHPDRINSF